MTKTEIVTALVAAEVSKDYNGVQLSYVSNFTIEAALKVAEMILEATKENS
jgi:hypothetical protein